jgi:hypothetical protein
LTCDVTDLPTERPMGQTPARSGGLAA